MNQINLHNYWPIDDAYSIHRVLNQYRVIKDNPNQWTDYQTQAVIVDEDGNQYKFQHSHSDSDLNGRPLPRMKDDCPRPNAEISKLTGECLDVCQTDFDCPLSYTCGVSQQDGMKRCFPTECSQDTDCDGAKCNDNHVCQPPMCDYALTHNESFDNPDRYPTEHCISTSHHWYQGRPGMAPLDKRYAGQY